MPTLKTQTVPVRLSNDTIHYLKDVIRETNARNMSEAVRLIIAERQLNDEAKGGIAPFRYVPAPTKRDRRTRAELAAAAEGSGAAQLPEVSEEIIKEVEPPATRGPDPHAIAGLSLPESCERDEAAEIVSERPAAAQLPKASDNVRDALGYWPSEEDKRPVYPGTMREYEKDPARKMFKPPENRGAAAL